MESALVARIADVYERHQVDGTALLTAFRDSVVLVPTADTKTMYTMTDQGATWIPTFTSAAELARFAVARGDGDAEWPYLTVHGWRLLETLAPGVGVVVDVAGERPMFFPAGSHASAAGKPDAPSPG